jgi:hypothetical protein
MSRHVASIARRLYGCGFEAKHIAQIAKRGVLSDDALSVLVPVLEDIVGWDSSAIRSLFESRGFLIQEWDKVRLTGDDKCDSDREESKLRLIETINA